MPEFIVSTSDDEIISTSVDAYNTSGMSGLVRCRDCRYSALLCSDCRVCKVHGGAGWFYTEPNGFCSNGKPMEEGDCDRV